MIEPIPRGMGVSRATAICDDCGRRDTVACDYERHGGAWHPNYGQIGKKLQAVGWSIMRGKLRCPKCEAKRKTEKQEAKVVKQERIVAVDAADIRKPTPLQRRQIIALLEEVYDDKAGRYRGAETDVTVAETIGGGVMFGWVAEVRCDLFGLSGENEEAEDFLGQIAEWQATADRAIEDARAAISVMADARVKVSEIEARMRAFQKAMGPKGGRV